MRLLYIISKYMLLPGAYLRGFWEHLACRILHIPVEPIGYIRPDEACGHAEHSLAKTPMKSWFLVTFPGFMNFNIGMTFWLVGVMGLFYLGNTIYDSIPVFIFYLVCLYLGMAFLNCLFPITDDILDLWDAYGYSHGGLFKKSIGTIIFGILFFPMACITRLGAFLEKHGINFLLGIAVIIAYLVFAM